MNETEERRVGWERRSHGEAEVKRIECPSK